MSADPTTSPDSEPPRPWNPLRWPLRQLCGFLIGLSIFLLGVERLAVILAIYFRLMSPPESGGTSPLEVMYMLPMLAAVGCGILALPLSCWRFFRRLPPPVRVPWLNWGGATLLILGVLSLMVAIALPATAKARMAQQQAAAEGPWREHVFADGVMRLSTPPYWELTPNPNLSASSIYLVDRLNDSYLTATLIPKQDLAIQTLPELAQQSAALLAQSVTDHTSSEFLPGELDGRPVIDIIHGGTLQGMNLGWYLRYVEYPDAWLELRMWTTRSRYENQFPTFDRIATSLRGPQ